MDNKTAIQELMEIVEMDANNGVEISMRVFYKMLQDSLPKERQQIEEAFVAGDERGTNNIPFNAEQYFNQTYQNTQQNPELLTQ